MIAALLLAAATAASNCPVGRHIVAAFQGGLPVWERSGQVGVLSAAAGPLPAPLTIVSCSSGFYFFMTDGAKRGVERSYVRTDQVQAPVCPPSPQVGRAEGVVSRGTMGATDGGLCPAGSSKDADSPKAKR